MNDDLGAFLAPTAFLDCDSPVIAAAAEKITSSCADAAEKGAALFAFVRDTVRYNPYVNFLDEKVYRSSAVIAGESTFCVPKAILLASLARAAGIASRLRFADIRNHLLPQKMKDLLQTDIIYGHGFAELFIDGRWLKATPAFDRALCEDQGFILTEFTGHDHAVFPSHDLRGRKHIDYVEYSQAFDDFPFQWLTSYYLEKYPAFRDLESLLRQQLNSR
jgi:transglutaminase-like putative cysteine protease